VLAMLSNTASPTILRAGRKINVIPGLAEAEIDGRLLPGQSVESFLAELRAILGPQVELEVDRAEPPTVLDPYESPLYSTILSVLQAREPDAVIVPYLAPGFTDAMYFARLGIKWYGFSPVKLPRGMRFGDMYHGHNERVPVDGLRWGTEVLFDVVQRFTAA
jgi:acetylornithine deacetylase/succinyl-diaminopimelate desuccinylase-like protein